MASALRAQDHLYSVIVRGATSTTVEVIGSIVDYVFAADDPAELILRIAAPETQIVSLTITEGGYPVRRRHRRVHPGGRHGGQPERLRAPRGRVGSAAAGCVRDT